MLYGIARRFADLPGVPLIGDFLDSYALRKWGEPEINFLPVLADRTAVAVDVGANVGEYSRFMIKHFSHVLAIDANPACARLLKSKYGDKIEVKTLGLSDNPGELTLFVPKDFTATPGQASFVSNSLDRLECNQVKVKVDRLDNIVSSAQRPNVSLIKIDVEGYELSVLQGSIELLKVSRPNLLVESESRHHKDAPFNIFNFIKELGYYGWFIHGNDLIPIDEFRLEIHQRPKNLADKERRRLYYSNNFLFSVEKAVAGRLAAALKLQMA